MLAIAVGFCKCKTPPRAYVGQNGLIELTNLLQSGSQISWSFTWVAQGAVENGWQGTAARNL